MPAIAVTGDLTDVPGIPGRLVAPQGVVQSIESTVLLEGKPVVVVGSTVTTHGNPYNPKAPGFNPPCAHAVVTAQNASTNIFVNGKPLAIAGPAGVGTVCSCGHVLLGPGSPTIQIGIGG